MSAQAALAALALAAAAPVAAPPAQQPPPAWEATPVKADADEVKESTYVVQPGDTLLQVVRKTKAGADAIAQANALKPPFVLRPRQKLKIPAGRYHLVQRGQAGIAIARAYGVDWSRIATLNHLEEPFTLRAGERLLLPSATEVAKMSLEQRAAAFRIDIDDLVTGAEPALAPKAKPAKPTKTAEKPPPPAQPVAQPSAEPDAAPKRFAWPVRGRIVRSFGVAPNGARNNGINIAAARGTPILAAAEGVVAYAGPLAGFGQLVLIRHGGGWLTAYGYADALLVTRGQAVKGGQPIGRTGVPGTADEPQVHFEIRNGRAPINPVGMLPAG